MTTGQNYVGGDSHANSSPQTDATAFNTPLINFQAEVDYIQQDLLARIEQFMGHQNPLPALNNFFGFAILKDLHQHYPNSDLKTLAYAMSCLNSFHIELLELHHALSYAKEELHRQQAKAKEGLSHE